MKAYLYLILFPIITLAKVLYLVGEEMKMEQLWEDIHKLFDPAIRKCMWVIYIAIGSSVTSNTVWYCELVILKKEYVMSSCKAFFNRF